MGLDTYIGREPTIGDLEKQTIVLIKLIGLSCIKLIKEYWIL